MSFYWNHIVNGINEKDLHQILHLGKEDHSASQVTYVDNELMNDIANIKSFNSNYQSWLGNGWQVYSLKT